MALLLVVLVVAACSGSDPEPLAEATGPAALDVSIISHGQRRSERFDVSGGRLHEAAGQASSGRAVFSRAGDEPDRQSIVWEEIYLREPDGTERRLTSDRNADLAPQLLRDGRVSFLSCIFGEGDVPPNCSLDVIDPDRRMRETLIENLGIVVDGELSSGEDRFLFTRLDEALASTGLFVREIDGADERRLVDGYDGTWSPDGRRIAFASDRDENGSCLFHDCSGFAGEIYVANADGEDEQRLTENPHTDAAPEWSGDGDWIVLARIPDEDEDWDLHAVRADGACERQLTDTRRWEIAAAWSGGGHGGLGCP